MDALQEEGLASAEEKVEFLQTYEFTVDVHEYAFISQCLRHKKKARRSLDPSLDSPSTLTSYLNLCNLPYSTFRSRWITHSQPTRFVHTVQSPSACPAYDVGDVRQ
jgi:hypothetical protein